MKKFTGMIIGLSLSAMLSFGLVPSQSKQETHGNISKTNYVIVQSSHGDTW
ncbi:TPA: Phr family secreted Rap phosphatase inhibitor [Bacillus cereus]|jgi:hypothetical protein|nr:Phr family secreted Rap phosphatase inhibitor [Bacillus cereus]HDW3058393.1 Phr family secreted Rap phosphatase inhibitor [Bacillus cereus]